ncbi:MAG TPA: hypothetical protein ENI34_01555 [candidate division WOR-3 bacterium]|uniref:Fibronectin type-III domain-containing protein n=1 Tax=candidate division WOR-3 bacterium TaxID=2052148 RepID=A0A9C9JZJ6_UNCW3|nr:hypothetical protein [candidate division WOR-3 bacterium]
MFQLFISAITFLIIDQNILLQESFTDVQFPPVNWDTLSSDSTMVPWYRYNYTGAAGPDSFQARCRVYDASNPERQGWTFLKTPRIDLNFYTGPESLFFWYRFSQGSNNLGPDDTLFIEITNNDTVWSALLKLSQGADTNVWQIARIDLSPYDSCTDARIRFFYRDQPNDTLGQWNANFWLDSVKIISYSTDTIPPGAVTDLNCIDVGADYVCLQWTAPGDDGYTGRATCYDIRYADFPITASNFYSAVECNGEPPPSVAGQTDSFTVTPLSSGVQYYFALKTADEVMNWSSISNVPTCTTTTNEEILPISTAFRDLDSNFIPDLLDSIVTITGVITAPPGVFSNQEAYIQDTTAGVCLYGNFPETLDYNDSITATGRVSQYYGKNELADVTYSLIQHNASPPQAVEINGTMINSERYEGSLVKLKIAFIDAFLFEGNRIYNAWDSLNTAFSVWIDSYTNIPGALAPLDTFTLTGIKGQYSSSTPPNNGYQLMPRDTADFSHLLVMPPLLSISEIQKPGHDGVSSIYLDSIVVVQGVVTGPDYIFNTGNRNFYIQDETGGVNIYDVDGDSLFEKYVDTLGAVFQVIGTVTEYNGVTEISGGYAWFKGFDTLPRPRELPVNHLLTESMEGGLIKFNGVVKTPPYKTGDGYNIDILNGEAGITVRFTNNTGINPVSITKDEERVITGIVGQYDYEEPYTSGYQVLVRFPGDLNIAESDSASSKPLLFLSGDKTFIPEIGEQAEIRINAPLDNRLELTVYDMTYRKIKVLYSGAGGSHTIHWDGKDEYGKVCRLGIYLLVLKATAPDAATAYERTLVVIGTR